MQNVVKLVMKLFIFLIIMQHFKLYIFLLYEKIIASKKKKRLTNIRDILKRTLMIFFCLHGDKM